MTGKNSLPVPWLKSRTNIALLAFLGIAGYFLIAEHWAHVIQALPYLLVLGCVVMHLFMHGSHGHGSHSSGHQQDRFQSRGFRQPARARGVRRVNMDGWISLLLFAGFFYLMTRPQH